MANRRDVLLVFYKRREGGNGPLGRIDPRVALYFVLMIVLIGLAGWLYLVQSTQVAAYSHDIRNLQSEMERLHLEIVVLEGQVAELGSLERVLDLGEQMNYRLPEATDTGRRMQLPYQAPAASATPAPTGVLAWPGDEAAEHGGLWGELLQQLDDWANEPVSTEEP
jgi:hypothetical protein